MAVMSGVSRGLSFLSPLSASRLEQTLLNSKPTARVGSHAEIHHPSYLLLGLYYVYGLVESLVKTFIFCVGEYIFWLVPIKYSFSCLKVVY